MVELVVTLAIVAILVTLAVPYLADLAVRHTLTGIGREFSATVLRARNEAVSKNICVTLCMSATTDDTNPSCKTNGQDWQQGWIAFINPACNSSQNSPASVADLLLVHRSAGAAYGLKANAVSYRLLFTPRGSPGLGAANRFDLSHGGAASTMTRNHGFNICLDGMGRTRNVAADATC